MTFGGVDNNSRNLDKFDFLKKPPLNLCYHIVVGLKFIHFPGRLLKKTPKTLDIN